MGKRIVIYANNEDMADLRPLADRLEKKGDDVRFQSLKFLEPVKADVVLARSGGDLDRVKKLFDGSDTKVNAIDEGEAKSAREDADKAAEAAKTAIADVPGGGYEVVDYNGGDVLDPAKAHDQKSVRDSDENAKPVLTEEQVRAKANGQANLIDTHAPVHGEDDYDKTSIIVGGAKGTDSPETIDEAALQAQVVPLQAVRQDRKDLQPLKATRGNNVKTAEQAEAAAAEDVQVTETNRKANEINKGSKTAKDLGAEDKTERPELIPTGKVVHDEAEAMATEPRAPVGTRPKSA